MPLQYIVMHLVLSLAVFAVMLRLPAGSWAIKLVGVSIWLFVLFGFTIERRPDWGLAVMRLTTPDLPFLTNLTIEGAAVLVALMWNAAKTQNDRVRAVILAVPLAGVSLWSYAWFFAPAPAGLTGTADESGYCRQTTDDSCSAAAAVMLLNGKGVPTNEAEMAALCLTRSGKGTPALGVIRGLMRKATPYGCRLRLVTCVPSRLHDLHGPALISVGLSPTAPAATAARMREYGWEPGRYHSVVVMGGDASGKWLDVADPSYGREKWPAEHLAALWNGQAFVLSGGRAAPTWSVGR